MMKPYNIIFSEMIHLKQSDFLFDKNTFDTILLSKVGWLADLLSG